MNSQLYQTALWILQEIHYEVKTLKITQKKNIKDFYYLLGEWTYSIMLNKRKS